MGRQIGAAGEKGLFETVEPLIAAAAQRFRLGVETIGALVICFGVVLAIYQFILHFRVEQPSNFNRVQLTLGKHFALAPVFQVSADTSEKPAKSDTKI